MLSSAARLSVCTLGRARVVADACRSAAARGLSTTRVPAAADEPVVLTEKRGNVGIITINRPKALNALNADVAAGLTAAVRGFDADPEVGATVVTGSTRAFAAGADIKEMAGKTFPAFKHEDPDTTLLGLTRVGESRKPTVAAVCGFAFGGGCELAMMCDIIIAGDNAAFGQPEIKLGIIPGAGGTQRLTHAVGKSKAMQMCLTGDPITADQAERAGLVSEVVPADECLDRAVKVAGKIAAMSQPVVALARDAVNASFEVGLAEGNRLERFSFFTCFAMEDSTEGLTAFTEKRRPDFQHK